MSQSDFVAVLQKLQMSHFNSSKCTGSTSFIYKLKNSDRLKSEATDRLTEANKHIKRYNMGNSRMIHNDSFQAALELLKRDYRYITLLGLIKVIF